jgi:hypothetical protein
MAEHNKSADVELLAHRGKTGLSFLRNEIQRQLSRIYVGPAKAQPVVGNDLPSCMGAQRCRKISP